MKLETLIVPHNFKIDSSQIRTIMHISTFYFREPLIENDPRVDIGADGSGLQLAINTAQFGRTFQDRSHVFEIYPRDSDIGDDDTVFNLNVRGKRGNIVQTFPAVEYDFVPTTLTISEDDIVDIQWTGKIYNIL